MINNTSTIPLPDDIQKAIESARNNLTLMQVEISRLSKLKGQLEKEIGNLNSEKVNLENSVAHLTLNSAELISDNKILSDNLANAQKSLEKMKVEEDTISKEIIAQKADLSVKTVDFIKSMKQLDKDRTILNLDKELHEKSKAEFAKKTALLADTINKL